MNYYKDFARLTVDQLAEKIGCEISWYVKNQNAPLFSVCFCWCLVLLSLTTSTRKNSWLRLFEEADVVKKVVY
jgi:hypothetical protein